MAERKSLEGASSYEEISVAEIKPGKFQPRTLFDQEAIEELACSIREEGLAQPILLRPVEDEDGVKYEIVAGERRWRAFKLLGKKKIPAFIRDADDKKAALISLVENIQRENLTSIEEARAYKTMIDKLKMTQQEIADKVGKSRPAVANILRLLSLHPDVVHLVETKQIEAASARFLLSLPKGLQSDAADISVKRGLSSKQTENYVKSLIKKSVEKTEDAEDTEEEKEAEDTGASELQTAIQAGLNEGITATVKIKKDGSGKLSFDVPAELWDEFVSQFVQEAVEEE